MVSHELRAPQTSIKGLGHHRAGARGPSIGHGLHVLCSHAHDAQEGAELVPRRAVRMYADPLAGEIRGRAAFARAVASTELVGHWRCGATRDPGTPIGKRKLWERVRLLDSALEESNSVNSN